VVAQDEFCLFFALMKISKFNQEETLFFSLLHTKKIVSKLREKNKAAKTALDF
jgi:hypothetical protein